MFACEFTGCVDVSRLLFVACSGDAFKLALCFRVTGNCWRLIFIHDFGLCVLARLLACLVVYSCFDCCGVCVSWVV